MKSYPFNLHPTGSWRLIACLIFLTSGALHAEPRPGADSDTPSDFSKFLISFQRDIRKTTLPNGLRLIMVRRKQAPTVSCYMKFKAGASDETTSTSGIAHMLEHMLFKGTKKLGTIDYGREKKYIQIINLWAGRLDGWRHELERAQKREDAQKADRARSRIGIWKKRLRIMSDYARTFMRPNEDSYLYGLNGKRNYNAYTSRDLTNYQISLPANRLEVWARIESDRMQNAVMRDFYTERNVVAEERRMRVDNVAHNLLLEKFLIRVYGNHPYGRPVIGPMKNIVYFSRDEAYSFFRTFYAPNNTVIAVVGDIDFEQTERLINRYFGKLKPRQIPTAAQYPPPGPPDDARPSRLELRGRGSPLLLLAWPKPNFPHPVDLRLEILGDILTGGNDSRLFQKLVVREKLATSVKIYTGFPGERYENLFLIFALPAPEIPYDRLQNAILREIKEVVSGGVTKAEFQRIKKKLQSDFIIGLRSNAELADELSYYETVGGDYRSLFSHYRRLDRTDLQDIRLAAERYLTENRMFSARLLPPGKNKAKAPPEGEARVQKRSSRGGENS